ncbi:MAG TPA: glycosyltransferase [Lacibacter sp.]|nr:glycosyltransferase [Lacibacter sp.]
MSRPRLLIFYDHFYPAYRAGGPVQSLVNFVRAMADTFDCYVVCRSHEAGSRETLPGVIPDQWINWEEKARVYYGSPSQQSPARLRELIEEVQPDRVFINGIYSLYYNILPLRAALRYKDQHAGCIIVISARGMLLKGALAQKAFKKKIYLGLLRMLGWPARVQWHATDAAEAAAIRQQFGNNIHTGIAENFPNLLAPIPGPPKEAGNVVLGTIALIGPMKNHRKVLEALQQCHQSITWHIYGPVLDAPYWEDCQALIRQLPANIRVHYHGPVPPPQVPDVMKTFQVFIMPSQSENFGHALFEALSAGKPVITTDTTPFKNLQAATAGITLPAAQLPAGLATAITTFAEMNAPSFEEYVSGAGRHAQSRFDAVAVRDQYRKLFQL